MKHFKIVILLLIFISSAQFGYSGQKVEYPADLKQLHKNVLAEILSGNIDEARVQKLSNNLSETGQWPDVDYTSQQRGDWPTAAHLSYLQVLTKAYQKPGSAFYQDSKLQSKIHLALNYWLDTDLQNPNWWYPQIGVPMSLAPSLLLMEEELTADQKAKGIKILDRAKIGMTGQNKVWQSANVLLKSLLLRDVETIRKAAASIQEELKVGLGEGIQPDGSFHQHGPQIQFGNYGLAYVGDMIKWVRMLRNTPFNFDESKLAILRNYLLEGQQWVVWKNQMDISACGRQLFVNAQEGKARSLSNFLNQMETLDPQYAEAYKKANQYETLIGNKHFWRSDYQIQRTPDYYFSVKMCSERVIGAESCNSENIRGYYLGDGATYLFQSGDEYNDIFPYWDWKKIPGTTTKQDDRELPVLTASGYRIKSSFVGGVSDGITGIAAMDYVREEVSARKSWFLFNNHIVCLGAGISSNSGFPVTTSVNQSFLKGETVMKTSSEKTVAVGTSESVKPLWILNNKTGYYFPSGGTLRLEAKNVEGSWNRVATMYKDEIIKADVFGLWFEHGVNPAGQSYTYMIVPGADLTAMRKMEKQFPYVILKNDSEQQALVSVDKTMGGVVFYKAGKSDLFGGISTDQPCILMVKKEKNGLSFSVSDPTQKLNQLGLTLNGEPKCSHPSVTISNQGKPEIIVKLPSGEEAGKTVNFVLTNIK